jgi:hypothetical protein
MNYTCCHMPFIVSLRTAADTGYLGVAGILCDIWRYSLGKLQAGNRIRLGS